MPKLRLCTDCVQEWYNHNQAVFPVKRAREAPHPGPRCATHHRAVKKRRQEAAADTKRAVRYGITGTAYRERLAAQGGACAACGVVPGPRAKRLAVDHDHKQARLDGHPHDQACMKCFRGLICWRCNSTLADYRDNEKQLAGLVRYLQEWEYRNYPPRVITGIDAAIGFDAADPVGFIEQSIQRMRNVANSPMVTFVPVDDGEAGE